MDSFIKIIEQKKDPPVDTIHTKQIDLLKRYIRERKNVFICGSSGVGKTHILNAVLNESNSVEIHSDHLKSKNLPSICECGGDNLEIPHHYSWCPKG